MQVTAIKFMQSLDRSVYAKLEKIARERGVTMQELIRAVVVPDWIRIYNLDGNTMRLHPPVKKHT